VHCSQKLQSSKTESFFTRQSPCLLLNCAMEQNTGWWERESWNCETEHRQHIFNLHVGLTENKHNICSIVRLLRETWPAPHPPLSPHYVDSWLIAFLKPISHLIVKPLSFGQWQDKEVICPERKNRKYSIYSIQVRRKTRMIQRRATHCPTTRVSQSDAESYFSLVIPVS